MTESASVDLDPAVFQGVVSAIGDGALHLAIPGSDYVLQLMIDEPMAVAVGDIVRGRAHANARRIDSISAGGRCIEPLQGRPRRVQGRVMSIDEVNDTITVLASIPIVCATDRLQKAIQFKPNEMVSFDVAPGMTFEPVA